jgi:hypothetical protein
MKKVASIALSILLGLFAGYFIVYWISELWLGEILTSEYSNDPQPWQPPLIGALLWLFASITTGYISYLLLKRKFLKKEA